MKLNPLEVHDRLKHFTKQDFNISECCQNLIDQRPFGSYPFYIFAHTRTDEDGVTKRLIWQPRLTKPTAQTNSMLFKAYPGSDTIKVIWMIPDRAMWKQYMIGFMTENKTVLDSIYAFENNRQQLERSEPDDFDDAKINDIYKEIAAQARTDKMMNRIYET